MSPVKRRRRLPTLIDRGLGLLEVIMPRGSSEDCESVLPPGQRDGSGFWFPSGYDDPGKIFSAAQRELQANQRRIQKRRIAGRTIPPLSGPAARTQGPFETDLSHDAPAEVAMPLPTPLSDALLVRSIPAAAPAAPTRSPKPSPAFRPGLEGPLLPDSD